MGFYLDNLDLVVLKSTQDVTQDIITSSFDTKEIKVISKGDLVEVCKQDWEMYQAVKDNKNQFPYPYRARKKGNKNSRTFYSLWFLEEN